MDIKLKYEEHSNAITDELLGTFEIIDEDLPSYENLKKKIKKKHAKIIKQEYIYLYL